MIRTEWNALRAGDEVLVHVPAFPALPPHHGRVVGITVHARRTNEVAIRVGGSTDRVVRPPLTTVHRPAGAVGCWRCAELESRG